MNKRPPARQHSPLRSGSQGWEGRRLARAARAVAIVFGVLALAPGASAAEADAGLGLSRSPLRLSVDGPAAGSEIARADLEPPSGRLSSKISPVRASADGRYRLRLGPGRSLALTYRGRFIRNADAGDVDQQRHTPGLVLRQQLGDHLAASAGFQWTADIRDPDLTLRAARDSFFTQLQGRMPVFGTTQVRYEFVRTDSFDGAADARDLHRFVVKQDVAVGSPAPDLELHLLPYLEGGIASDVSARTTYDFQRVALAASLAARSGPSLWAQVGFDWLHYYQGPDSQPGDRTDHVTRLAARLRVPFLNRFSVFTDLSWRKDVSSIAEADSRTLRAGAGLELHF